MVDRILMERILTDIRSHVQDLTDASDITWEIYRMDKRSRRFVERTLHILIQACIDLAQPIIADEKHKKKSRERISNGEIRALEKIRLGFEIKDGDIYFSWSSATRESSGGVKIAYSSSHSQPLYPHDKYAKWIPGSGHSSCVILNHSAASEEPRYYRVCSVKPDNHSVLQAVKFINAHKLVGLRMSFDRADQGSARCCPSC